ncbi:MAG: hypothetical protein AAFV93_03555 [Chloroflexota bacterium]
MIAKQLLETGILQLGLFGEGQVPYRLRLEMLPAYPQLLQTIVYRGVQSLVGVSYFDRLVAHTDAIPIATAISLQLGTSLVYSRGHSEAPVHDLVGAYDIGHPACLIVNTLPPDIHTFLTNAQKVGLEIHSILEIVSTGINIEGIDQYSIVTMTALVHELQQANLITEHFASHLS